MKCEKLRFNTQTKGLKVGKTVIGMNSLRVVVGRWSYCRHPCGRPSLKAYVSRVGDLGSLPDCHHQVSQEGGALLFLEGDEQRNVHIEDMPSEDFFFFFLSLILNSALTSS